MVDVRELINNLIRQDRGSDLETLIFGFLKLIQKELVEPVERINREASVISAGGVNLDNIGERFLERRISVAVDEISVFGFDNNGLGFDQGPFVDESGNTRIPITDDVYRRYIIARGGQITTDGTVPVMNSTLETAFGGGHYIDKNDMSMIVRLDTILREDQLIGVRETGLITKPAGVRIQEVDITHGGEFFGFDDNGQGFDQNPFANIVNI